MRSIFSVGVVGVLDIVGDQVGSNDGFIELLGLTEGLIEEEGCNDRLGLPEGIKEEDGFVEGVIDSDNEGCIVGSFDVLIYFHFCSLLDPMHRVISTIASNPF